MSQRVADPERTPTAMPLAVALGGLAGLACTVIWASTSRGYYWPCWVWLGVALAFMPYVWAQRWRAAPATVDRWVRLHGDVSLTAAITLVLIWLFTGVHGWWVTVPVQSLLLLWIVHALIAHRHDLPLARGRELLDRVETLSRTRRQAIDAQAAELRRIERDLHDGAQARLVALSMQLGRAEARLADQPEIAELVRSARQEASVAIGELRDLARGIAPPVLTDRGLPAAVRSLVDRAAGSVELSVARLPERLPPAVENAAYFVVAEALTNVAKHAPQASARVGLTVVERMLVIEVADDGPGGADAGGRGLQGLRARVEALDGTFEVTSPLGGPTVLQVEVPCAS